MSQLDDGEDAEGILPVNSRLPAFSSVPEAITALSQGKMIVVVDDAHRENEGNLVCAADLVTPELINFMMMYGRGLICVPMSAKRLSALRIPRMAAKTKDNNETAFCVGVDAVTNGTGITAADRAETVTRLVNRESTLEDFRCPGHTFPVWAVEGGVLRRAGHPEAAVDFAMLAERFPGAVMCEIMADNGTLARGSELETFAAKHNLCMVTIADLIRFRHQAEKLVELIAEAPVPTTFGEFRAVGYRSLLDNMEHVAFVRGDVAHQENVLVRVHSECLTGDVFGSQRCDCGVQLNEALNRIAAEDCGVVLYFRGHEGRGIGLMHKLRAYSLQDRGRDTVEANLELGFKADQRDYGIGAQILVDLGVTTMRLLTNNPAKRAGIEGYGLEITGRESLLTPTHPENIRYLRTKQAKLGHLLDGLNLDTVVDFDAPLPSAPSLSAPDSEERASGGN